MQGKRLARVIRDLKSTSGHGQFCHDGDTASERKQGFSKTPILLEILEDSKSASGGMFCMFVSSYFYADFVDM